MARETRRKCERCGNHDSELRGLYLGLIDDVEIYTVVPVMPCSLVGGVIEICADCYMQWEAAMTTWFGLAAVGSGEDSAMGAVN